MFEQCVTVVCRPPKYIALVLSNVPKESVSIHVNSDTAGWATGRHPACKNTVEREREREREQLSQSRPCRDSRILWLDCQCCVWCSCSIVHYVDLNMILLHCTLSLVAQCIVIGPVCVCGGRCLCEGLLPWKHEIACINFHQTGSVGEGGDHLQLIKFWPSCAPGKGVWVLLVCILNFFYLITKLMDE